MLEWFSLFSQLRIHMNSSFYQDNWNQKVVILSFSFSSTKFKNSLARTVAVFPHHSWHWHPSFDICPSLHLGAGFSSSCWDLMTQGIPFGYPSSSSLPTKHTNNSFSVWFFDFPVHCFLFLHPTTLNLTLIHKALFTYLSQVPDNIHSVKSSVHSSTLLYFPAAFGTSCSIHCLIPSYGFKSS